MPPSYEDGQILLPDPIVISPSLAERYLCSMNAVTTTTTQWMSQYRTGPNDAERTSIT